ncbi:MAG: prephenate dehydrogenase [Spirochaetia bacterium]|nr:prephenate dehydrogenase [Spirochaetia bacterium]
MQNESQNKPKKYFIWGMGLLGASLAYDLKKLGHQVFGCVRSEKNLNTLKKIGFENCYQTTDNSLWEPLKICDGIIIGTPIDTIFPLFQKFIENNVPENIWITDMASTKSDLIEWVNKWDEKLLIVGSHPMAGSDLGGPENAREGLFSKATIFITPAEKMAEKYEADVYENTVCEIENFWKSVLANTYRVSHKNHDKWAAYLSHGLHLASCLVSHLINDIPEVYKVPYNVTGGSFRDLTRVAGSNPQLWQGIIESNLEEVTKYMQSLENLARNWRQAMEKKALPIAEIFEKSSEIRKKILKTSE